LKGVTTAHLSISYQHSDQSPLGPDTAELASLLRERQWDAVVSWLWVNCRQRCVQFAVRRHAGLDDDEVCGAVTCAYVDLHRQLSEDGFAGGGSDLIPMLLVIADRRAKDVYRKKTAAKRGGYADPLSLDEFQDEYGQTISDEEMPVIEQVEIEELRAHLRKVAESLPGNQRLLVELMADQLPEQLRLADVPKLLKQRGQACPSRASLKRALEHARERLRRDPKIQTLFAGNE